MNQFEYARPTSVEEAVGLLGTAWGETEVLAGGTDLITCIKQHISAPKRVVSLKNIGDLRGITEDAAALHVGATTPLKEFAEHASVQQLFPALVTAVREIGSAQIINMGTVAGDLCQRPRCWYFRNEHGLLGTQDGVSLVIEGDNRYHAIFGNEGPAYFVSPSSLGPGLVALGAMVSVAGAEGATREVPCGEFFKTPMTEAERETALQPNEIVTGIHIPKRGLKNATYEIRHRHGLDWPYVTATVAYKDDGGAASEAVVVLGHVAPTPWVATGAGVALNGALTAELAAKAGEAAVEGAKPLSRNGYKVPMVKTAVKRAILRAAGLEEVQA
jgi:xanthine dehydrogenase YagS FAD-binding subunit